MHVESLRPAGRRLTGCLLPLVSVPNLLMLMFTYYYYSKFSKLKYTFFCKSFYLLISNHQIAMCFCNLATFLFVYVFVSGKWTLSICPEIACCPYLVSTNYLLFRTYKYLVHILTYNKTKGNWNKTWLSSIIRKCQDNQAAVRAAIIKSKLPGRHPWTFQNLSRSVRYVVLTHFHQPRVLSYY